jgi:hypothetical protein
VATGCQAWQPSNEIVFGLSTRNATVRLPVTSSQVLLTAGTRTVLLSASVTVAAGDSFRLDFQASDGVGFNDQGGVLTGAGLIHSRAGAAIRGSCARIVVPESERLDPARRIEHETVLLARY